MGKFLSCRRGGSAVEFAMLLPVFLSIVFGIVVFRSCIAVVHGIQQLAAEAAHSFIAGLTGIERDLIASAYATSNAVTYPPINESKPSLNAVTSSSNANVFLVAVNYDASATFFQSLLLAPMSRSQVTRSTVPCW